MSRVGGSTGGLPDLCATASGPAWDVSNRQQDGSRICVESETKKEPYADCGTHFSVGRVQSVGLVSLLPSLGGECKSRHFKHMLSGLKQMDVESEMSPTTVCSVGHPGSGLMASPLNAKLPMFFSQFFHPRARGQDTLSQRWIFRPVYVFPLTSLIRKMNRP